MTKRFPTVLGMIVATSIGFPGVALSTSEVLDAPPSQPNAAAKYLFYMHGRYVERKGASGDHQYTAVLDALAKKGLIVIGEVRPDTNPRAYSEKIAEQVNGLLGAGVPAKNITVAGFSRGGVITLLSAGRLRNKDIKYGVLAGCGTKGSEFRRSYIRFIKRRAKQMRGRFLVAWDEADEKTRECDLAMQKAGVEYRNLELRTGRGHRLFFKPDPVWLDPLASFALSD